ncbi:MAG: SRPBCC domain-containing protein [Pseudomonadota bacterium]
MSDLPTYELERTFAAPQETVWRVWTDPDLLHRWYGPGVETTIHRFDLRPGGEWLNEMKWGENSNYSRMVFQEIDAPSKLVWNHHSCTDAEWRDMQNPMMADWPRVLHTIVTFEARGEQTFVTLTQEPLEASDAEIACFRDAMANMDKGWGSGYALIDEMLAELAGEA